MDTGTLATPTRRRQPRQPGQRRRWRLVWALACLVVSAVVLGDLGEAVAAWAQQAEENPWALPPETVQKGVKSSDFQNPDVCARCHPKIYSDWAKSMHKQYANPAFQWAFEEASKQTDGAVDGFCPRCHSPIAVLGGEKITPGEYRQLSDIAQKGVQCDFCHTLSGVSPDWPGNGSFRVDPGALKRGPLKGAVSPFHKTQYMELYTKADFCGMCHNLGHPGTHLQLENTYTEWRGSQYAKKGITCQDCHMPTTKGQAATKGPMRDVNVHTFVGGNVRGAAAQTAQEILKKAASVELGVSDEDVDYGGVVTFTAKVRNKGAGHYLPTGITELRRMWLELRVTDVRGRVVFARDHLFATIMEDAQGVHDGSVQIWEAVKVYTDNRIAPNTTAKIPISWSVPTTLTRGPVKVTAELKYKSLPDEFARQAGIADNPVTVMAVAEPQTIRVTPTVGGWILAILTPALVGGSYMLPIIFVLVAAVVVIVYVVRARRSRPGGTTSAP